MPVWEVVQGLELFEVQVVSLTSDGAKPNRKFFRLCQVKEKTSVSYKTSNPFREGAEVYFFCDAPHLLKTARSNSFAHSGSRHMMVNYYRNRHIMM